MSSTCFLDEDPSDRNT